MYGLVQLHVPCPAAVRTFRHKYLFKRVIASLARLAFICPSGLPKLLRLLYTCMCGTPLLWAHQETKLDKEREWERESLCCIIAITHLLCVSTSSVFFLSFIYLLPTTSVPYSVYVFLNLTIGLIIIVVLIIIIVKVFDTHTHIHSFSQGTWIQIEINVPVSKPHYTLFSFKHFRRQLQYKTKCNKLSLPLFRQKKGNLMDVRGKCLVEKIRLAFWQSVFRPPSTIKKNFVVNLYNNVVGTLSKYNLLLFLPHSLTHSLTTSTQSSHYNGDLLSNFPTNQKSHFITKWTHPDIHTNKMMFWNKN